MGLFSTIGSVANVASTVTGSVMKFGTSIVRGVGSFASSKVGKFAMFTGAAAILGKVASGQSLGQSIDSVGKGAGNLFGNFIGAIKNTVGGVLGRFTNSGLTKAKETVDRAASVGESTLESIKNSVSEMPDPAQSQVVAEKLGVDTPKTEATKETPAKDEPAASVC